MEDIREKRAKLNIEISLLGQLITLICGLIVPRLLLGAFGSEAYGATASISQFLSYITLLEGGVGGVARAALYRPLAENDDETISAVVAEIKRFFNIIGLVFAIYVIILAASYYSISHVQCFDWMSTFLLVIVISISTFAQYFIGISYSVLLQAAQKTYITQMIYSGATILNMLLTVVLVKVDASLIAVKFISSLVFAIRPFLTWMYVRKNYNIMTIRNTNKQYLTQKWTGLGQHLAFFLHNNTDIAVLTILENLRSVSIYSVYNMVVANVQNFSSSFATGMEALFGDMLAKNEKELFNTTFSKYEALISMMSCVLLGTTTILIVPFVKLYTSSITDANYSRPFFALLLIISALFYCWMMPYDKTVLAAGHFKQTRFGPYGEAIINISFSVVLVIKWGLIGVAIGTIAATLYRYIYYAVYLTNNICYRPLKLFIRRFFFNCIVLTVIVIPGLILIKNISIDNYFSWILSGVAVCSYSLIVTLAMNFAVYREDTIGALSIIKK